MRLLNNYIKKVPDFYFKFEFSISPQQNSKYASGLRFIVVYTIFLY